MAANPPIVVTFSNPAPEDCPTTFTETIALLNAYVSAVLQGNYSPYVTGAATPDVDDQDKVWHRTDVNGRPLGTYVFYSGAWRREYSGNLGEVTMYNGDPAVDFAGAGGLGTVGGNWDGWALMNGNNGTDDLSDTFIVMGNMADLTVGYPSGTGPWQTGVSGVTTSTGGTKDVTLTNNNLEAVTVAKWKADGNTPDAGSGLYGIGSSINLVGADTPTPVPILPPYRVLACAQFIGYA